MAVSDNGARAGDTASDTLSESYYREVFDSLSIQVAVLDCDGRIRSSNSAWQKNYTGFVAPEANNLMAEGRYLDACEAALAASSARSTAPDGRMRAYVAALRDIISGARDTFAMEYPVPGNDGWFRVHLNRCSSGNGNMVIQRRSITAEKQAGLAAEDARRFLQTVIDLLPTRIAWKDTEGRFQGANRAFLEDSGLPNIVGKTARDMPWGPRSGRLIQDKDRRLLETGEPQLGEVLAINRADGSIRWIRLDRLPLLAADGSVSGLIVAYVDITEMKQVEATLAQQALELKRLALVAEHTSNAVIIMDNKRRILWTNDAFTRMSGYTTTDVQGQRPQDVLLSSMASPESIETIRKAVEAGAGYKHEQLERTRDGRDYWVEADHQPLYENGELTGWIAVKRDVTEKRLAEQRLEAAAERLTLATEAAGIGVWERDLLADKTYWDDRMREIYGQPADLPNEGIGRDLVTGLCHPNDVTILGDTFKKAAASARNFSVEYRIIRPDGEHRHLDMRGMIHRDNDGKPVRIVGTTMDVTERNRLVQERHASQRLESIGRLAAGIAHEINTPTQYIGDNTSFLRDSFGHLLELLNLLCADPPPTPAEAKAAWEAADGDYLQEEIPHAIEQSLEGIKRVSGIVSAMKDFSHPATERTPHNLNRAIQSTLMVASNEWKYVADVITDLDPELPSVPVMPGEFNQVILNMVVNAAHAIAAVPGFDGATKGKITITTCLDGDHAVITLSDSGCGIPDHIKKRIFEPFFTTKEVGRGTGQGLAITHNFVTRHDGTINVDSTPGKGTTFTLRLPIDVKEATAQVA